MNKKLIAILSVVLLVSVILVGCGKSTSPVATTSKFVGNWKDINEPDRFANISVASDGTYVWVDNEGTYKGKVTNNVLKIPVGKDTAVVVYDKVTDHIKATLYDETAELQRK